MIHYMTHKAEALEARLGVQPEPAQELVKEPTDEPTLAEVEQRVTVVEQKVDQIVADYEAGCLKAADTLVEATK